MESPLNNARNSFENLSLTESYRNKRFTKNFEKHLNLLIDTAVLLTGDNSTILNDNSISITDQIYWESEGFVLEILDDVTDSSIINELSNLEDILYEKIKSSLGRFNDNSSRLNLMIDQSVHNALLGVKFNYFSQSMNYFNPWESAKDILIENEVLYTFSNDMDKLISMGYEISSDDSQEIIDKKINIIGRGSREDYTYGFVRDLVGLRNTVLNILDEHATSGDSATTADKIINELRHMGIRQEELSDGNIKNWLISPLKRNNKIGSHKEGYFLLKNCDDVSVSYESHLENLKGYFRTLENHRRLAHKFGCNNPRFDEHREFFRNFNNDL